MVPAGIDHEILLAAHLIGHRRGLPTAGQHVLPDGLASAQIDRADEIVGRRRDEHQPARSHHRAAVIGRADGDRQHRRDAERSVGPRLPKRAVPDRLARRHVDRADSTIRRLLAQHAGEGQPPAGVDVDRIGRVGLRIARTLGTADLAAGLVARRPAQLVGLGTRDQADVVRHVVVIGDDHPARRIDCDAAPIGSAIIARIFDRMPVALGRGEEALIARPAELDPADHLVDRRHAPHVALGQVGFAQRMPQRHRLGRRPLPGFDPAPGCAHLADRSQRPPGAAIEHIDVTLLRRQHERWYALVGDQGGLRTEVIIPHVLAHRLEAPARLAGGHVQRDQRRRERILLGPAQRRIIVRCGIAHRQIDQAKLLVTRGDRPHVGGAAGPFLALGRIAVPLRVHHVPRPAQLAGARVEALDHAGGRPAVLPVEHLMPGDENPAHQSRWRVDRDEAGGNFAHADLGVGLAVGAEIGAQPARPRIDRDQPGVERTFNDPGRAGLISGQTGHRIIDHAPACGSVGDCRVRYLRIVAPALLARRRIERDHDVLRRAQIQRIAHLERGVFGAVGVADLRRGRKVAGVDRPGATELADILGVDLRQRRIAARAISATISRPVGADLLARRIAHALRTRRR